MDEARFESAWNAHCAPLTRYCTFSTGSRQDGEDIAAETFARLLATKRHIDPGKVEAWLFTVARNLCVSRHRAATRDRKLLGRLATRSVTVEGEAWSDSVLWEAVCDLDERSRLVIYLRAIEDRTFADVARLTDSSQSAAKMAYYRGMDRLRTMLNTSESERVEPRVGGVVDVD